LNGQLSRTLPGRFISVEEPEWCGHHAGIATTAGRAVLTASSQLL